MPNGSPVCAAATPFDALRRELRSCGLSLIKIVYYSYEGVLRATDGRLFCFLFNLKSRLLGWDVRFVAGEGGGPYRAVSSRYSRFFYHRQQANYAYRGGIPQRARKIGEDYFLPLVSFSQGDLVVDCGANVGDLSLYFQEKGLEVEYLGIEPSPKEFACLEKNVHPAKALNFGLWHEDHELDFFVSSQGADSSFILPADYSSVVKVPAKRLDSLVDRKIKLLKVEAEGAEPEVLRGCDGLLGKIEYISADLGFERGLEQSSTLVPVTNYLLERGFELVTLSHDRIVALFRNRELSRRQ